ncbi:ssDNA binding protein [Gordonia phage Skog]|uniref:SsDNA binding protein n=1 Tax=Gordonia phage Skog TaxID=2704033 RepID=A0A6G6XKR6_9CAUD|nr:single strand DNA binding protein [Gordonia phage Skog]QIG58363.1 ssDNA binding protein [Gordonia phage Skog]
MARTGLDALKGAINSANSAGGNFGGKLGYANWKDGDTHVIRFVTDVQDILTCDFYEYIVDHKGKTQNFTALPDLIEGATDWVKHYGGKTRENGMTGDLVDPTPRQRTVAIAVLREEVPVEVNGKTRIGYQDVFEEIEIKGKKYASRKFLLVKQSHKNFWQPMVGFYDEYGTLCDRDYKITRSGAKTDTTYQIVPKDADREEFDLAKHYEQYGYGKPFDENDDDRFLYCPQTLTEWAEQYGSEDRVKFWILGEKEGGDSKGGSSSTAKKPFGDRSSAASDDTPPFEPDAPVADTSGTDFDSLRARLAGH